MFHDDITRYQDTLHGTRFISNRFCRMKTQKRGQDTANAKKLGLTVEQLRNEITWLKSLFEDESNKLVFRLEIWPFSVRNNLF